MGWFRALLLVALWRAASELMEQRRALRAAGVLDARIAARRAARITRTLDRLGLAPAGGPLPADAWSLAAPVGASAVGRPSRPSTDWGRLVEVAADSRAHRGRARRTTVPAWANLSAAAGAVLTLAALLRPLSDAAPWLAVAGVALALAGLVAARRR